VVVSVSALGKKYPEASNSSDLSAKSLRTPSSESPVYGGSEELAGTAD